MICGNKTLNVLGPFSHNCYSPKYETCEACETIKKLKEENPLVLPTGGRYEYVVVCSDPLPRGTKACYEQLPARGEWGIVSFGNFNALVIVAYGSLTVVPEAEVVADFPVSVHGSWKIRKNQTGLVYLHPEEHRWRINYSYQTGSYDRLDTYVRTPDGRVWFLDGLTDPVEVELSRLRKRAKTKRGYTFLGRFDGKPVLSFIPFETAPEVGEYHVFENNGSIIEARLLF